MKRLLTSCGAALSVLGLLAAWADFTPMASIVETRTLAVAASIAGLALLALRWRRGGATLAVMAALAAGLVASIWSLSLLFAYRSEGVVFEGEDSTLVGTLYLPASEGPHPGAVFIHGSGAETREGFLSQAKLLARRGIAALVFDKRGSGKSTGDLAVPYETFAADAVAAAEVLARHQAVDPQRIGYFGHSEGAWVAPIAAAGSRCAFIVATGGTDLTPAGQVLFESLAEVRRAGFGEQAVEQVETLQRELLEYQRSGRAPEGLEARLARALEQPWAGPAELPSELWDPEDYAWWRSVMDFDPLPHWREVECPVLLVSGGRDTRNDVTESQARIEAAVEAGGGPEVGTVVFPNADHMVLEWPLGERIPPPRWPPGYRELLACWLRDVTALGSSTACLPAADAPSRSAIAAAPPSRGFAEHLDELVPSLLAVTGVPGVAVGLVSENEVAALRTYGAADLATGRPMTTDTVFNAGSISKVLTAWGVMRLVEEGRLDLDRPVIEVLPVWPLPPSSYDPSGVTVRRLLSHTAGLSMSAVPEYGPGEDLPRLEEALGDTELGVRLEAEPGTGWSYSGGGYMLLQHLVDVATERPFADFMEEAVLDPLGMDDSGFSWTTELLAAAATPYEDGTPVAFHRYVGQAAASLNTTVTDLARFAAAGLARGGESPSPGMLRPETLSLMWSPAPGTEQAYGVRTGLGYHLWGLERWNRMVGHNGQNTGWAAAYWVIPSSGDGLVVLTNASDGETVWRWVLCDWVAWTSGTTYRGLCTGRPASLPEAPAERAQPPIPDDAPRFGLVDRLLQERSRRRRDVADLASSGGSGSEDLAPREAHHFP